jgi:hypothetical protein
MRLYYIIDSSEIKQPEVIFTKLKIIIIISLQKTGIIEIPEFSV